MRSIFMSGGGPQARNELERFVMFLPAAMPTTPPRQTGRVCITYGGMIPYLPLPPLCEIVLSI